MSNEDEINELRRLVEAERKENEEKEAHRRELMRGYSRKAKEKTKNDPEAYARMRETTNAWRKANSVSVKHIRRKRERLAGRPKPETCEVCGRGGEIVFDHDHNSNKFRGWLCGRCNTALGMVNDDIVVLEKLIVYLKAHQDAEE
jgi:hypothetical protein